MNKWVWTGVGLAVLIAFLAWLFIESSKPLPGEKQAYNCDNYIDFSKLENVNVTDKCRVHVQVGTKVKYPTNPPVHGPHYAEWVRPGIYETPRDDRNLVHSMEHGYIIISYNCDKQLTSNKSLVTSVYAHGIEEASESSEATNSSQLSAAFRSEQCHKLVDQLISIYEKKNKKKIVIAPKPSLDTGIALTAWSYIDKFDDFDAARIEKFIDAHRDMGPEKTME